MDSVHDRRGLVALAHQKGLTQLCLELKNFLEEVGDGSADFLLIAKPKVVSPLYQDKKSLTWSSNALAQSSIEALANSSLSPRTTSFGTRIALKKPKSYSARRGDISTKASTLRSSIVARVAT
jgi:hypothetical protein